ncbi:hypothetical protein S349_30 [Shewanella sp. phage 3/49]|uniref:hypothetical protein n=1 Tax=Shewanella sp. phage 3/49 TaxID=1458863 RepID=UPI0004F73E6B|nr:hypothetical protein S349_30 [Shewanella sp. phage 3/49]AHK11820.1 hypothetical protein S349_30 [Shewanella sp. phage 3/49]
MALTKSGLFSLINSNIPDNTEGEVSPSDVRAVCTQNADSALNVLETATQTVAGNTNFTGGLKSLGKEVLTDASEIDLIRGYSLAATQLPTGLGVPLQVEFGAAQADENITLAANGAVTCLITETYAVRIKLQLGRTGASGTSIMFARILVNGVQVGVSQLSKLSTADNVTALDSRVLLPLTAGDVLTVQIIRDSAGTNFGGLYAATSSHGWVLAPTALLVISAIEPV